MGECRHRLKSGCRNEVLAAGGWRACEEVWIPVPDDRTNFKKLGCVLLNPNQRHYDSQNQERHNGVHYDAKRAAVRGART